MTTPMHPTDARKLRGDGDRIHVRMDRLADGDDAIAATLAADLRNALHVVATRMTPGERAELRRMLGFLTHTLS